MKLPIGTKIEFTKTLSADATGDRPAIVYANQGDKGEVIGHDCEEGHMVKLDGWDYPFGAVLDEEFIEFDPILKVEIKEVDVPDLQFKWKSNVRKINDAFTDFFLKIIEEHSQPKIKSPITSSKLSHRGIKLLQQRRGNHNVYWLEQRGVHIGGKFIVSIEFKIESNE